MNNTNNIEKSIRNSIQEITPDVFNNITANNQPAKIIKIHSHKKIFSAVAGIAAALMLVAFGGLYIDSNAVDSLVSIDVNPSIELKLNKKEKIIDANALNDDAKVILNGLKLKNQNLDVAVDQIVISMLKNGYIDEMHNAVLVSIDNKDGKKTDLLQTKINECIRLVLEGAHIKPIIYNQKGNGNMENQTNNKDKTISNGKKSLIDMIVKADSTYTVEQLSKLSMTEISKIIDKLDLEDQIECHRFDKDDFCEYCGKPEIECQNKCDRTQKEKYCDDCGKVKDKCICVESSETSSQEEPENDDEKESDTSSDSEAVSSEQPDYCTNCGKLESVCKETCKKSLTPHKFCDDCGKTKSDCKCENDEVSDDDTDTDDVESTQQQPSDDNVRK